MSAEPEPSVSERRAAMPVQQVKREFIDYPLPLEGPYVPFRYAEVSNPVIRGKALQVGAALITSVGYLQTYLWSNAGFGVLRGIKDLDNYTPRYDPTVTPKSPATTTDQHDQQQQQPGLPDLPAPSRTKAGQNEEGYYSSADYRAQYLAKTLTPTAVVEALLPLIRRDAAAAGEHSIAFIETQAELVRRAAAESTKRYDAGRSLGPLDGVPVAVKDEVDVAGYKRRVGSSLDFTGPETSWCVRMLERAGAVVLGKTNMHELGLDTTNNNPVWGTPRNPHNPEYYTGGSSGGSGYAVSAGLVPIAHGADGGGSIRLPANYCGIYGLKPSHGRISGAPTVEIATTTGVHGPLAATLDDLALAYRVMATPDPDSESSSAFPDPRAEIPTAEQLASRPRMLGVYKDWVNRAGKPVLAAFRRMVEFYETQRGYTVVDISIPYLPEGQKAHALTILSEIASTLTRKQIAALSAPNKVLVTVGNATRSADFLAAQRLRNLLMRHLAFLFRKFPGLVIVTPTTPTAGARIVGGDADLGPHGISNADASLRSMEYVWLANFTGCPAINRPMAYEDKTGVPLGIMGMGEWGSEELLIEWAREGEAFLKDVTGQEGGLKRPRGKMVSKDGTDWVDVLGMVGEGGEAAPQA
ncbi:hypothetical protein KEM52_005218 [Ascosphaera acerosa]|nr:hypothetical protein KEM52_005218 [Ascosphaera acerosa]